ncbi:MAG: hypothetical protein WA364_26820, partial [Candidatus Nitrosopolaris sp.]
YFTSTDSSINIAYDRTIHRYKVFPSKDISISINENPRSKQNFNTIRLLGSWYRSLCSGDLGVGKYYR